MAEKRDSGQAGMTTGRIARVPSFPLVGNPSLRHTISHLLNGYYFKWDKIVKLMGNIGKAGEEFLYDTLK